MSIIISTLFAIILLSAFSIYYVYSIRGELRYASFIEYVRKGWPVFTPFNCLLYLFTEKRARKPVMDLADFPELKTLQDNWQTIAEEALALQQQHVFDKIGEKESASYYDVGFRTFYKYGWSKFYLTWYGNHTHASAQRLCPKTVELIKKCPSVNGSLFTLLPPGSELTRHLDPFATSMRYHLGLSTPNSDEAYINVDGKKLSWRDGEAFMFDETYLHYAKNPTKDYRLILMCDVERPMSLPGRFFNFFYKSFLRLSVVPNTDEDERGLANKVFSSLTPILNKGKALKQTNKPLYKLVKFFVNTILLLIVLGLIAALLYIPYAAIQLAQ